MSSTPTPPSLVRFTSSNFSMRVIAAAIILLFFYYAAGVVITLLLSILLAYFLDPAVEFLERMRLPRTLGAMFMVLILIEGSKARFRRLLRIPEHHPRPPCGRNPLSFAT